MSNDEIFKVNTMVNLFSYYEEYSYVVTIENFINDILKANKIFEINYNTFINSDSKEIFNLKIFLAKSIICFSVNSYDYHSLLNEISKFSTVEIYSNMKIADLLFNSIMELHEENGANSQNYIQMIGLKLDSKPDSIYDNPLNVLKNYTNKLINSKNFELLRLVVGDIVFKFLLKSTSIFIYEEKVQNFVQVTGISLKDPILKMLGIQSTKYVSPKMFGNNIYQINTAPLEKEENENKRKNWIPFQKFNVERTKIFYCPNFNRKLGFFKTALKSNKFPNQINYLYTKMFEVYTTLVPTNIETIIKQNIELIVKNINSFEYYKTLFKFCSLDKNWKEKKKTILEKLSLAITREDKNIPELNKELEYLLNNTVEYNKIFNFISTFLENIIPRKFIGKNNLKIILQKLKIFIEMNRFETLNRTNLFEMKEFSFKQMSWLEINKMNKENFVEKGILLKNFIMKNIIFWIFDLLVVQLVRSHFYVTEKQTHHNKTFYYHKKDWDLIMKINEIKLQVQFTPINRENAIKILHDKDSTFGKLRLMPKPSTCRPIVSYKKRTAKSKALLKNLLFETQKVFKFLSTKMQNKKENCVVFDYKTIIQKLIYYKEILKKHCNNSETMLKYCTLDIEACYDNIDIEKLISILDNDDIISENFVANLIYVIFPKPHVLMKRNKSDVSFKDCFEVKRFYIVTELSEYIHFLDFLKNKTDINYSFCLIYQEYNCLTYIHKEQFMPRVKNILTNNIIKFNKKLFKQVKGIPQGLSISSFLCNLYFYNLERQMTQQISRNIYEKNLLMRFMDDYLCLTTNESVVINFIDNSKKLAQANKFNFNLKKSKTNVNVLMQKQNPNENNIFSWNGINFDLNRENFFNTLIDSKEDYDIKRYATLLNINIPIIVNKNDYTMLSKNDFNWYCQKIKAILITGHPWMYFVSDINDHSTLNKNFEDFCRVVTYKIIILTRSMSSVNLKPSQSLFIEIIDSCLKKMFFYFNVKISKSENKKFFYKDFQTFVRNFYFNVFAIYIDIEATNLDSYVYKRDIISHSPFLFKTIRRKIIRLNSENKMNID